MADHFEKISVKDEHSQEDIFLEDKVYISETAIMINNAELQGHGKIKQYEESTCLDDIKTELVSFQMTDTEIDNIKVEEGISTDDAKIEVIAFNNGLLYCEHCEEYYVDYCIECGMLVQILNKHASNNADSEALKGIPNDILEIQDRFGHIGIYASRIIPAGVKFGPFTGLSTTECLWEMQGQNFVLDKNKSKYLNWMQYVNPARNIGDGNLRVFKSERNIYYQSTRQIQPGDELLVYFGEDFGKSLNKIVRVDFVSTMKDIAKDIFACTFCCLGFNLKSHLAKHKTVCAEHAARKISIEELMQCPFCKIHLDMKEYFEHHVAFCCENNARKCILPTAPGEQATTALNGRRRRLRQIYRCEQCKYRTKYQADIKKHTKQHYEVKMYKCGICNRCFKIKESLRLHVENTHTYVGGRNNQENYTIEKKIFKCSLCVFQAKYIQSLRIHIKTKHLKEFDHKCDKCEFGTNRKTDLKRHINSKHLKEFDYKCDNCQFGTNHKQYLERHIKANHLNEFDYKCDSCEYRTNNKCHLEVHIKTKHLEQFDYKCDKCKYKTNNETDLKIHLKTKHLKEFDYRCDSCGYRTNKKSNFEVHIKIKHLKEFDYKCDSCEFGSSNKADLNRHIKTKHLKQFDYKCDSCEYKTNKKYNLAEHMKRKHL